MVGAEQDVLTIIYTIGHSNHPLQTFLELLRQHDIEVLIDTRSSPFSRYAPHFNRDALRVAVQDAGIKYGFYGRELGGRPENPAFYDAAGHADYAQIAASELFQSGLARLIAGAAKHRTALLCSEENPSVCHRRLLISRVLFDQDISVSHIRGDGCLETERELREAEAAFAKEQKLRQEEKQKEKQAAADLKAQVLEARRAARRMLAEEAADQKLQRRQATAAARVEKQQHRREAAEQQSSERKRQAAQRKLLRLEASQPPQSRKSAASKQEAAPKLFDMEEP